MSDVSLEKDYSPKTRMRIYDNAYLNDCKYCIYCPVCYGISGMGGGKRGTLAEKKCIIRGWRPMKTRKKRIID